MNVLVYSGPGTCPLSVRQTLHSLRRCIGRFYDIKAVDEAVVQGEPWEKSCALLVMPGGRDVPYLDALNGPGASRIKNWVGQMGGKYLGICAGAYFAASNIEFDSGGSLEVVGERPLGFFSGLAKGPVFAGFQYRSHVGACAALLSSPKDLSSFRAYFDGGCHFECGDSDSLEVLARYQESSSKPSVILARCNNGLALLSGVHMEYDPELLEEEELPAGLLDSLKADNAKRLDFWKFCLEKLGLHLCADTSPSLTLSPLCIYTAECSQDLDWIPKEGCIQGPTNSFYITKERTAEIRPDELHYPIYLSNSHLDLSPGMTFRPSLYFEGLRSKSLGKLLIYAEKIMSTQTLLTHNHSFASSLPNGTVVLAGDQMAGKGRGKNSWLSSSGCLQFTMILDHQSPHTLSIVQYLVATAMAQVINSNALVEKGKVFLKWPNDVYAKVGETGDLKKIGGILVTSQSHQNGFRLLIGFGINVYNTPWSLCLNDLMRDGCGMNKEELLSSFVACFETLYHQMICSNRFPYELYYRNWLHTGEIVFLEEEQTKVRIEGIDSNGYLVAHAIDDGLYGLSYYPKTKDQTTFLLQPDGNSFDMMRKLIHRKQ